MSILPPPAKRYHLGHLWTHDQIHYHFDVTAPVDLIEKIMDMEEVMPTDEISREVVIEFHRKDHGDRPQEHTFHIVPYVDPQQAYDLIKQRLEAGVLDDDPVSAHDDVISSLAWLGFQYTGESKDCQEAWRNRDWRQPYGIDSPEDRELMHTIDRYRRHGEPLTGLKWRESDDPCHPANDPRHPYYIHPEEQ